MPEAVIRNKKRSVWIERARYILLVVLIYGSVFREMLEKTGGSAVENVFRVFAACGIPSFVILAFSGKRWKRITIAGGIGILIFCASGLAGYFRYRYQSFSVTMNALEAAVMFWLWLGCFSCLFRHFSLEKWGRRLSLHVSFLSAVLIICTAADMFFKIWPRQAYRKGIGSIQIFYGHPSVLAINAAFLLVLLLLLIPYARLPRIVAPFMILPLFMTLRIRVWGFLAGTLLLVLWFGILKKKMHPGVVLAAVAAIGGIGWDRFHGFYLDQDNWRTARGEFVLNSLKIARENFPFGTGFGTFGSRAAQIWYSPVYYWYEMYSAAGMDPLWPSYACDTFWPMILGETGALGFAAYLVLMGLLIYGVLLQQKKGPWLFVAAAAAILFELTESMGALAFADPQSAGFALVLGLIFGLPSLNGENS